MPHPTKPGPGRPRSDVRVAVSYKLQPEVWGLLKALADTAFAGNVTRALEHAIRIGSVGLEPTPYDPPERARRIGARRQRRATAG